MTLKALITAQILAQEDVQPTIGSASAKLALSAAIPLANGVGNSKADGIFTGKRQLGGSATENLDLAGVLTDVYGQVLNAGKVKAVLIVADAGNSGDIVVGAAASNPFVGPLGGTLPTIAVRPGGVLLFADPNGGWPVTPATGDLLKIANAGSGVGTYSISIIAASA